MARTGLPKYWNERRKGSLLPIVLPEGATFYSTPSHGYLEVDTRLLEAKPSGYDYKDGDFVYLEEDCSVSVWLAERGLIPMTPYIEDCIKTIPRE